jgi:tetratricopeptide (TPR) repeat protein
MPKRLARRLAMLSFLFVLLLTNAAADSTTHPLQPSELLGLVAGNALPENVVREIATNGLAFRPDDAYRTLLKTAGADAKILSALSSAKVSVERVPDTEAKDLLQHLATAGKLMNEKRYDQTARELSDALTGSPQSPEAAFVMGQLLRLAEHFEQSAAIYEQVLHEAPDFPEVHTKLSYILHRMEDSQGSLTEARAALKLNPENAEAHKNAGLALEDMRKDDASLAEYQEALHLKPDYEAVRLDLGLLYCNKREWATANAEFQKATRLDPADVDALYNVGFSYDKMGDFESAIRAYREVKKLDPTRFDARQNLGADLMNHNHIPEAVAEFRELERRYPDAQICVLCLGRGALFFVEGFLGVRYGAAAREFVVHQKSASVAMLVALIAIFVAIRWFPMHRRNQQSPTV